MTLCLLSTLTFSSSVAYGRLGPTDNATTIPTPEQLKECKTLGIDPDQCSDITILGKRCLGGPNSPCGGVARLPPELDPFTLSILIGCGVAFVTGIFAVKKIRKVRKKRIE